MTPEELLSFLRLAARLKGMPRHCRTTTGTEETVAAHAWRLALLAWLLQDEQPDVDMRRVMELALVHDLGEAVTGDIPTFLKTARDEEAESRAVEGLLAALPEESREELAGLFREMEALRTPEARLWKALDKLEALIQHNEADISTWLPLEYDLQLSYGQKETRFSPWLRALMEEVNEDSRRKIREAKEAKSPRG